MKTFFILTVMGLVACGATGSVRDEGGLVAMDSIAREFKPVAECVDITNFGDSLNQTARMIAGISNSQDTLFGAVRQSVAWREYAKRSDLVWQQFPLRNRELMAWVSREIRPLTENVTELFYPFSGPDMLYADLFFPNARVIRMCGLEPVGSVIDMESVSSDEIQGYTDYFEQAIGEILTDSYYRTANMNKYLRNAKVDGVLPVLMLYMARLSKQITQIELVTLDPTGRVTTVGDDGWGRKFQNKGVRVRYHNSRDSIIRELIYISGDAQEKALAANVPYKKYIESIKADAAFTKSASYLLHHSIFETVRRSILAGVDMVVSDDTGIAYRYYDPRTWDVQLYGSYSGCIDDFKYILEKDLLAAYSDSTRCIKPLKFRIGYSRPSNMRIATRRDVK